MKKNLAIFAALLLAFVNAFWMLSSMSLDSHECFVSVTAREMLQENDYIWPTLNGVARLQKTPLCYWLVAALGKLTGSIDELSARLPGAIFAFLSAVALLFYLRQWLSLRAAVISAAVWSTSLAYIRCSHSARPDMTMTFFIVLCMLSFYSAATCQQRRQQVIHALVFWFSFALANLAKGPAPVAYVLIPIAVYVILGKKWRALGKMLPFVGAFIFLVIVIPWPLVIAHKLNWNLILWKHEFIDRLYGDYAPGHFPFYYYLLIMFKYITPWVVLLPMALAAPFYRGWGGKKPLMLYLWIWFVANFVFLTLNVCKRQHYILPIIPSIAILIGILLDEMIFIRKAYSVEFAKNILRTYAVVLIAAALISPVVIFFTAPHLLGGAIMIGAVTLVWTSATTGLFAKQKFKWAAVCIFTGITVFICLCRYSFSAALDMDADSRDFARTIARIVPAPDKDKLLAYKNATSRFVQYYGRAVPETSDISELEKLYQDGCWIICLSEYNTESFKNANFRIVYSGQQDKHKPDADGVLMHISAPAEEKIP